MISDPLQVERNEAPANLQGLWAPCPAFLLGSGPSGVGSDAKQIGQRGIVSMATNNTAALAPVRAWCFSDPQKKFHHALFLDPSIMTFSPIPKLKRYVVAKVNGEFYQTDVRVSECPNTYGYARSTQFDPENFFTTTFAHWGSGKHQPEGVEPSGCLATLFLGIRLLYYLGVRRIYLLGVDHYGGRRRWAKESKCFERMLPVFEKHRLEMFNCNPRSEFRVVPFVRFEHAVADCKGSVPHEPLDVEGYYAKREVKRQVEKNLKFKPLHFS